MGLGVTGSTYAVTGLLAEKGVGEGFSAEVEVQLYIGNPGIEGKNNPAAENKKKKVTIAKGAASASAANNTAGEWVEVKAKETYTYFGLYNLAGGFMGYGQFNEPIAVEIGDTFKIPAGQLTVTAE